MPDKKKEPPKETPKNLDLEAMKLTLSDTMKESILGFYGDKESDESLFKMHTAIEITDKLKIDDLEVKVTLKELRASRKKFIKLNLLEEEE